MTRRSDGAVTAEDEREAPRMLVAAWKAVSPLVIEDIAKRPKDDTARDVLARAILMRGKKDA